ncbi:hypothetical protein BpHYR1_044603 [Brachionus plicatilis]|uniref:Uncharacterized protein n=1 Tax=Brachionus plicatilis TaxID=10195 RepID=A0A3M7PTE9_BRAPC|nr:hypothetical protein BpHYR1_044603 [Brachionus plicatilis]
MNGASGFSGVFNGESERSGDFLPSSPIIVTVYTSDPPELTVNFRFRSCSFSPYLGPFSLKFSDPISGSVNLAIFPGGHSVPPEANTIKYYKITDFKVLDNDDMTSDHYPIRTCLSVEHFTMDIQAQDKLDFKKADWNSFRAILSSNQKQPTSNINELNEFITKNILEAVEKASQNNQTNRINQHYHKTLSA